MEIMRKNQNPQNNSTESRYNNIKIKIVKI